MHRYSTRVVSYHTSHRSRVNPSVFLASPGVRPFLCLKQRSLYVLGMSSEGESVGLARAGGQGPNLHLSFGNGACHA